MKIRDILREDKDPNLRGLIVDILEKIYFDASGGDDMTDDITDELGDYFTQVQQSRDPELQMAYEEMRDQADAEPEQQAVVALAAIRLLMGPGYRPRPREPLGPEGQAWVEKMVAQWDALLKKSNIKTRPGEAS